MTAVSEAIDPADFRRVLGNFPTGVAVITAIPDAEGPAGMVVGSFTSVSLDPPLVAYLPAKISSSYRRLAPARSFCVNFLGAHQETLCRVFASKAVDKFAGLDWTQAPSGSPILPGVIGWVDCEVETVHDAGDHDIVVGRVRALSTGSDVAPLVFFRGGYGRFSTSSLIAGSAPDLLAHLKLADMARPHVEELARRLQLGVSVTVRSGNEIVILASAGPTPVSRLGERLPFAAPMGAIHAAWESPDVARAWIANLGEIDAARAEHHLASLERVRRRGWSVGLDRSRQQMLEAAMAEALRRGHSSGALETVRQALTDRAMVHDPKDLAGADGLVEAAVVTAPVRKPSGQTALGISLTGFPSSLEPAAFDRIVAALLATCDAVTTEIAPYLRGSSPA